METFTEIQERNDLNSTKLLLINDNQYTFVVEIIPI